MQATITPTQRESPSSEGVTLRYQTPRSQGMTFTNEKMRVWTVNQIPSGATVLNVCAGETELELDAPDDVEIIRNDIDEEIEADLHVDVREIADHIESSSIDLILHDPPFSSEMSVERYGADDETRYGEQTMAQFRELLKPGGKLIQWGYSPLLNRHFEVSDCALFNTVGRGKDFVATTQTYRPEEVGTTSVSTDSTVGFDPVIEGVTGGAEFGGNQGIDVEMTLRGGGDIDPEQAVIDAVKRRKKGVTVVVTDRPRILSPIDDHNTAIISINEEVDAHNHIGVRELSDHLQQLRGVVDTVVVDFCNTSLFSYNCYYEEDTPWDEITDKTGYPKALKTEALNLLDGAGRLIQIGNTATNAPKESGLVRTHVDLTATTDQTIVPFVTVDQYPGASTTELESDSLLWPTPRYTNERTRPSTFRYESAKEGLYHHPAIYTVCPECNAGQANLCLTEDGTPAPHGEYHEERVERGEARFYSEGTLLPFAEYVRDHWAKTRSTDSALPETAGGENKTPPAARLPDDDSPQVTLTEF